MSLTLHMMVLNGAPLLSRTIRPLEGSIREICFVDTGSTDGTRYEIVKLASAMGCKVQGVMVSPKQNPEMFFIDSQSSFDLRLPSIIFTSTPQLKDWAATRNLSIPDCTGQFIIRLDVGDEVLTPQYINPTIGFLAAKPEIDFLMCPYEIMIGSDINYTISNHFIWRNKSEYRYKYVMHEHIPGRNADGSNWITAQRGIVVRDWRDSEDLRSRVPYRNFKVLLLEYERCKRSGEEVNGHVRLNLAYEGRVLVPEFAHEVLGDPEDFPMAIGWAHYIRGECLQRMKRLEEAKEEFKVSALAGETRGRLALGFLQYETSDSAYRDTLQQALRDRRTAMSCQIPLNNIRRAEHILTSKG